MKAYLTSPACRPWLRAFFGAYLLAVLVVCLSPQPSWPVETPGIIKWGRLVFLLRPFNTLFSLHQLTSIWQLLWVVVQNLLNILLLYPLALLGLLLVNGRAGLKQVLLATFAMSLTIEVSQLVLDALIDANRVFELDDLWTNTLGGYLAYKTWQFLDKT